MTVDIASNPGVWEEDEGTGTVGVGVVDVVIVVGVGEEDDVVATGVDVVTGVDACEGTEVGDEVGNDGNGGVNVLVSTV